MDDDDKVVGMISLSDILRYLAIRPLPESQKAEILRNHNSDKHSDDMFTNNNESPEDITTTNHDAHIAAQCDAVFTKSSSSSPRSQSAKVGFILPATVAASPPNASRYQGAALHDTM